MIGSLFAGHEESPGKTVEVDGELFKEYYGSSPATSTRASTSMWRASASWNRSRASWPHADRDGAGRAKLHPAMPAAPGSWTSAKVNYVILGGDNAGEHLLM